MLLKRRKRAAPSDIYPACKLSGTCPPDILNKYEQNTLADKILKYGSAGVFLGTLGIGTGRGTGGSFGYAPIGGTGVRVGTRVSTIRPTLPVGTDSIPINAVDPLGPVVPPDLPTVIEEPLQILPPRFPTAVEEDVFINENTVEVPITTTKVTTDEQPAVLEVTSETREPRLLSRTQYENPAFEVSLTTSAGAGETSATDHILVYGNAGGVHIGEQVELADFSLRSYETSIETETSFTTSTPVTRPRAIPRPRGRSLQSRYYQQVRVTDPQIFAQPRNLVTFRNPAFDASVDILFDQDVADIALAAPNTDFADIVSLSKPVYTRTAQGVRVSRVGQKASMKTRSGLVIGPQTHFYYDLSEIAPAEMFELHPMSNAPLGETSADAVITSGSGSMETISLSDSSLASYPEDALLDEYEPVGNDLQLVVGGGGRRTRPISVPHFFRPVPQVFPEFEGVHINYGPPKNTSPLPIDPSEGSVIQFDLLGGDQDFFLHPSLLRRKRRKLLVF
ncbi:minor capsid protein L2 [Leopardus wiedii papillomavirus type 1]|uniref:Minor capsid protein L2 n=1 Tax=Leopardus wiedii papillomavirus type 1 TaxID=2495531 RepID=A0A3S8V2P1_9PAPI|nr:minor capsid protein L2 [Leopardus wiedii papillomavirus type 1]